MPSKRMTAVFCLLMAAVFLMPTAASFSGGEDRSTAAPVEIEDEPVNYDYYADHQPTLAASDGSYDWIRENADFYYPVGSDRIVADDETQGFMTYNERILWAHQQVAARENHMNTNSGLSIRDDTTNVWAADLNVSGAVISNWGSLSLGMVGSDTIFDFVFIDNGTGGLSAECKLEARQVPYLEDQALDEGKLYDSITEPVTTTGGGANDTATLTWTPTMMDIYLINISVSSGLSEAQDDPNDNFYWLIAYLNTLQDSCADDSTNTWEYDPPKGTNKWHITTDIYQDPGDGNPDNNPQGTASGDPDTRPIHTLDGAWYYGDDGTHTYGNDVKDSIILDLTYPAGFDKSNINVEDYAFGVCYQFYGATQAGTEVQNYQDGDHFRTYIWDSEESAWVMMADLNGTGLVDDSWYSWRSGSYSGILLNSFNDDDNVVLDDLRMKLEFESDSSVNDLGIYVDDIIVYGVEFNLNKDMGLQRFKPIKPIGGEDVEVGFIVKNYGIENQPSGPVKVTIYDETNTEIYTTTTTVSANKREEVESSITWSVPDVEDPAMFNISVATTLDGDEYPSNDDWHYWCTVTPSSTKDANILLVDNDFGIKTRAWFNELYNPFKDVDPMMREALWDLGYDFNVVTMPFGARYDNANYLLDYEIVIWMTGYSQGYYDIGVDMHEELHLMEYLNASGNLWLIGQSLPCNFLGYYPWVTDLPLPEEGDFLYDYLKIEQVEGYRGTANPIQGVDGTFTEGLGDGNGFTTDPIFRDREDSFDYAAGLVPQDSAQVVLSGSNTSLSPVDNAIFYDGSDFRTLTFGFEWAFISSPADRKAITDLCIKALQGGALVWGDAPEQKTVLPGETTVMTLSLTNDGTRVDTVSVELDPVKVPEGWTFELNGSSFDIPAGESVDVELHLTLGTDLTKDSLKENFPQDSDAVMIELKATSGNTGNEYTLPLPNPFKVGGLEEVALTTASTAVAVTPDIMTNVSITAEYTTNKESSTSTANLGVSGASWADLDKKTLDFSDANTKTVTLTLEPTALVAPGVYPITVTGAIGSSSNELGIDATVGTLQKVDVVFSKSTKGTQPVEAVEFDLVEAEDGFVVSDFGLFFFNEGNVNVNITAKLAVEDGSIATEDLPSIADVLVNPKAKSDDKDNYALALAKDDFKLPDDVIEPNTMDDIDTNLLVKYKIEGGSEQTFKIPLKVIHAPFAMPEIGTIDAPSKVSDGEDLTVTVPITNVGDKDGNFKVIVEVTPKGGDPTMEDEQVSVGAGESKDAEIRFEAKKGDTYKVYVEGFENDSVLLDVEVTASSGDDDDDDDDDDDSPWKDLDTDTQDAWEDNGDDETDSDGDNLPDWWEELKGLDPDDPEDATQDDIDDYELEKDAWEDKPSSESSDDEGDGGGSGLIIIVVIIVVVVVVLVLFMMMNKKKGEEMEEPPEGPGRREPPARPEPEE